MTNRREWNPRYAYTVHLPGVPPSMARAIVTDALTREGIEVVTVVDVAATLADRTGADFRSYLILEACHPDLSLRALQKDPSLGLFVPYRVCVWEESSGSAVSVLHPYAIYSVTQNPALESLIHEDDWRLRRVMEHVQLEAAHPVGEPCS